jgi:hypothetical protein
MKYENQIFRILCVLSLLTILSIFFINKCNSQTLIDLPKENNYIFNENNINKIK